MEVLVSEAPVTVEWDTALVAFIYSSGNPYTGLEYIDQWVGNVLVLHAQGLGLISQYCKTRQHTKRNP